MMDIDVGAVAVHELCAPQVPTVKQYLAVHSLGAGARPTPVHIVRHANDVHHVHFAVDGEPYFLTVTVVVADGRAEVCGAFITPQVRVHLSIGSDTLHPSEITKRIGIEPTSYGTRAGTRLPGWREKHYWDFEPRRPLPDDFGNILEEFLDELEPARDQIAALAASGEADVCLAICYQDHQQISGFALNTGIIAKLAAVSCRLWFDPYVSGPDLID